MAARAHRTGTRSSGMLGQILARTVMRGVPADEADLFSYLYFDGSFTTPLVELGREDTRRQEDAIVALLAD
jgi:hypothetical protein